MASGTISTRPREEGVLSQGRYDDFIQKRLEHTRRQVRLVDILSGVVLLAAASLLFFLAVAVADHWLFPQGLGFFVRFLLWCVWVGIAGWFAWRTVAPSIMHRINPVYAAQAIEHGRPTLKNSLINFLLLRSHPDDVAPVVYQAMQYRAASDLSRVPVDHAVDHRRLVHLCYVLAGAVVLFALYLAFSPKNPLVSAARVLWPWSSLPAPTRVHIEDVKPGNAVAFQGDRQVISAHVLGLRSGEEVSLLLSTADGQLVDDRIAMARTGDDDLYAIELPQGGGGMQQDTLYRITAGDARTPQFKLEVQIAPTILVDRVDYEFPPYTALPPRTIKGQGDIKALEGTRVTIYGTSNLEIKEAAIELRLADLSQTRTMKHAGKQATGSFTLALDPSQKWKPQYDRYQILFKDSEGHPSRHEVQYHVDVDRDYPPEIRIDEPKEDAVAVPVNGQLKLRVHATDDFGLRRVAFHAECNGRPLDLPVLFDRIAPEKAITKPYDGDCDFQPAKLGLHKGDEVTYWAEAEDNKEPQPNHNETAHRTIRIVDEQEGKQGQKNEGQQGSGDGQPSGTPQKGGSRGQSKGRDAQGEKAQGEQGDGAQGENGNSKEGTSTGQPSASGKGGADKKQDKSDNSPDSGKKDSSKPDKASASKDGSTSDSKSDGNDEQDSAGGGGPQDKQPLNGDTQAAEAIQKSLKDLENQQRQGQQKGQSDDNSQPGQQPEQKPQDGGPQNLQPQNSGTPSGQPPNGGPQGGQPQNSAAQGGQPQSGGPKDGQPQSSQPQNSGGRDGTQKESNGNNQPQGAEQGGQKPKGGSSEKNQEGSNSGNPPSQEKQGGSAPNNNSAGKQPTQGSKESGSQGAEKASVKQRNESQSPDGGPQPNGGEKSGEQRSGGPSSPQNAGSEGKNQPKSNAGSEKSEANSGGSNKAQNQQGGGNQGNEKQASGGTQPAKEKAASGSKTGSPSGDKANNAEKRPLGSAGGENNGQTATNGAKPEHKSGSSGGNSANQQPPSGSKQGNKPKAESGNSSGGGSQGQRSKPEKNEQAGGSGSGGEKQPKPGQGDKASPGADKESANGTKGTNPGNMAEGDSRQMTPSSRGELTNQSSKGAPAPQTDSGPGEPKAGESGGAGQKPNDPQSPGNSEKTSDTNGQSPGDRKGNGGGGGGGDQRSKKNGEGTPGSHSVGGEDGGSISNEKGAGAPGKKAGEKLQATDNTSSPQKESGEGGGKAQASEQQSSENAAKPPSDSTQGTGTSQPQSGGNKPGQPSSQQGPGQGSSFPTGGNRANGQAPPADQADHAEADKPDLELSNKQVDLALRHLKDEMTKPKSDLMDRLGWTPEEAKKFVENIEKLRDSAKQPGAGDADKKAYDEFLKDLGLRPHGTRIEGAKTKAEDLAHVRDAGDMEPPAEYQEQSRDYSKTMAEGNHK